LSSRWHGDVDDVAVIRSIEASTLLVPTPDGRIAWLGDVLDGIVLTQRARAPLAQRRDLWCGVSLQPLLNLAAYAPPPLEGGGEVGRMHSGEDVLVGPDGWLPDVPRHGLVALSWVGGILRVREVRAEDMPPPAEQHEVRALIADHNRRERWWIGEDDLATRPAELVRALTLAKQEDPGVLAKPHPPLDELLYNPLEREVDEHHWRDFASCRQEESVSRSLQGIPVALDVELSARARLYGMSFDQFVIAILGQLAWRTPFAEDCEPYSGWDPERPASLSVIRDGATSWRHVRRARVAPCRSTCAVSWSPWPNDPTRLSCWPGSVPGWSATGFD